MWLEPIALPCGGGVIAEPAAAVGAGQIGTQGHHAGADHDAGEGSMHVTGEACNKTVYQFLHTSKFLHKQSSRYSGQMCAEWVWARVWQGMWLGS